MIYQILLYALILILNPLYDSYLIEIKHRSPNHKKHAFVVGSLVVCICVVTCVLRHSLLPVLPLVMYAGVRWVVHDLLLNLLRGLDWDYIGEPEEDFEDSNLDNYLYETKTNQWILKSLMLWFSSVFCIVLHYVFSNLNLL